MADVQLEDGFTRLANELLEALIQFKFTEVQYSLLLLVVRMSYGCGKKTASFRKWIDISKLTGIDRQNVKPNLWYLQAAHVLFVDWENIVMAIDKNYDHWHVPKKPFIDRVLMENTTRKNLHCNDIMTNVITELQMSLPDNTDLLSTLAKSNYIITKKGEIVITQLQLVITQLQTPSSNTHENKPLDPPKESKENKEIAAASSKEFATLEDPTDGTPIYSKEEVQEKLNDQMYFQENSKRILGFNDSQIEDAIVSFGLQCCLDSIEELSAAADRYTKQGRKIDSLAGLFFSICQQNKKAHGGRRY